MSDTPDEFDCVECGRHIVRIVSYEDDLPICALCQHLPGWYNDPDCVRVFDPDRADTQT